jgi:transposase
MGRPGQRFVPVRSIDNQAELMRHRARELLAGQRTAALNALRGHLAEIGLIAPQGAVSHAYGLKRVAADGFNENGEIIVPDCVRGALRSLVGQIDALDEAIGAIDRELAASVKVDETAKRLMTIPGVGPVTASAIMATIQDASAFASGHEFAAFLGLTPRQNSTGGKTRLGRITKMGDRYLRRLLVVGACATLRHRGGHSDALRLWASGMLERKTVKYKFNLTAVALANKVARIVFVLMTRGGQYDRRPVAA